MEGHTTIAADPTIIPIGVQTEFVVQSDPTSLIVTAGEQLELQATVTDVEDPSVKLSGVELDLYFDWGGPLQTILQSSSTSSRE